VKSHKKYATKTQTCLPAGRNTKAHKIEFEKLTLVKFRDFVLNW